MIITVKVFVSSKLAANNKPRQRTLNTRHPYKAQVQVGRCDQLVDKRCVLTLTCFTSHT